MVSDEHSSMKVVTMLMQVVKIQKNGLIQTKYLFPTGGKSKQKIWKNGKEHLLDPKRFGIVLPDKVHTLYPGKLEVRDKKGVCLK